MRSQDTDSWFLAFVIVIHWNYYVFLAAFLTQTVVVDDTTVKFEIWDTAGKFQ